jgi:hypothetical protein
LHVTPSADVGSDGGSGFEDQRRLAFVDEVRGGSEADRSGADDGDW